MFVIIGSAIVARRTDAERELAREQGGASDPEISWKSPLDIAPAKQLHCWRLELDSSSIKFHEQRIFLIRARSHCER